MAAGRVEVEGLMYVTCEIQPLSGMGCVLPRSTEGARDKGAEDERVPSGDMRQHGVRGEQERHEKGTRERSSGGAERTEDTRGAGTREHARGRDTQ